MSRIRENSITNAEGTGTWVLETPEGYNPNAIDGDGDGIIQEGTPFERSIGT